MSRCISKCRDPLYSMLTRLHSLITTTWPDTVVSEPESMDREGWIDFSCPGRDGDQVVFAGVRFRRDKPAGMTMVLPVQPEHDPQEWVHYDVGKNRPLGHALGLPRPFRKDLNDAEWEYLLDLVTQARTSIGAR